MNQENVMAMIICSAIVAFAGVIAIAVTHVRAVQAVAAAVCPS